MSNKNHTIDSEQIVTCTHTFESMLCCFGQRMQFPERQHSRDPACLIGELWFDTYAIPVGVAICIYCSIYPTGRTNSQDAIDTMNHSLVDSFLWCYMKWNESYHFTFTHDVECAFSNPGRMHLKFFRKNFICFSQNPDISNNARMVCPASGTRRCRFCSCQTVDMPPRLSSGDVQIGTIQFCSKTRYLNHFQKV